MMDYLGPYLVPLAFAAGGLVTALLAEVVLAGLASRAKASGKVVTEAVLRSLRGATFIGVAVLWSFMALPHVGLRPESSRTAGAALMVLGILAATLAVQRLVTAAVLARGKKARAVPVSLLAAALRIVVILTGALVIFQSLGVSVTPFVTALGIGGLAVALALQDTLANLFAGIHILASGQVRRGDYVKLDSGEEGYVDDITWRNTSIRMLANNTVIVPNTKLASSTVVNYYRPAKELSVRVPVGVSYESDLERVEQVTLEVAHEALREVPGGVADFKPWVLFTAFADFSVNLLVVLRVREYVDQYLMIHEFVKRLHRRYAEEGIVIPFPIRTVHLKGDADHGPDVRAACPSAGPKGAQAGAGGD